MSDLGIYRVVKIDQREMLLAWEYEPGHLAGGGFGCVRVDLEKAHIPPGSFRLNDRVTFEDVR